MKKSLFKEYFSVSPTEKITEKVFMTRMILSIASIIICVLSVSFCALAYFNHDNVTMTVVIRKFDVDVTAPDECHKISTNTYRLDNQSDTAATYEFVLTRAENSADLGYCRINVSDNSGKVQSYYTKPIGSYLEDGQSVSKNSRTVTVTVDAKKTVSVNVTAQNGSCAFDTIDNEIIIK